MDVRVSVPAWHVAEINIARARWPLGDPMMASFIAQLDEVNRIADESSGFVWRMKSENGGASTYVRFDDDERLIVNMSVWMSIEALHAFTYRARHGGAFKERQRWFERLEGPPLALWWIPAGQIPSLDEGRRRLALLTESGPTPQAFTFKRRFEPPDR